MLLSSSRLQVQIWKLQSGLYARWSCLTVRLHAQAQRQGSEQEVARLQAQAFEAINDSVRSASTDTLPLVAHLVPLMLTKLGSTMQTPITSVDEHERQSELQVRSAHRSGLAARPC